MGGSYPDSHPTAQTVTGCVPHQHHGASTCPIGDQPRDGQALTPLTSRGTEQLATAAEAPARKIICQAYPAGRTAHRSSGHR